MFKKNINFSFKKLFFMKSFFSSLVGKIEATDKPLNWLSIVFLIAFDIFIFVNLLDWLDNQRQNIASPYEKYSYQCKDIFNFEWDIDENDFKIINNSYSNWITKDINAPFYDESFVRNNKSEFCLEIDNFLSKIKSDKEFKINYPKLVSLEEELSKLETKKYNYEREYDEFRDDYNSWLGDYDNRITDINNNSIRTDYEKILAQISFTQSQIIEVTQDLNEIKWVYKLKDYVYKNKDFFNAEVENYNFWYPVYITLMEAILILPILLFTILLYNFAIKRRLRILSILSSNLAFISGIFAFYIFIKVIYWILPKKFFANLITYLASIKALAIWNYILTIFGIILFGALMFGSQRAIEKYKKIKEEQAREREKWDMERIGKERYWNKACIECNTKLLDWATHCSNCWANQYKECSKCKNMMPKAYTHCEKCWEKN